VYVIIGTSECPACIQAEEVLVKYNKNYIKENIDQIEPIRKLGWIKFMNETFDTSRVPQIFYHIGGLEDLRQKLLVEEYK
jgi:glutaredoxin